MQNDYKLFKDANYAHYLKKIAAILNFQKEGHALEAYLALNELRIQTKEGYQVMLC